MPVYYRQDCGPTAASLMFCIVQEQLEFLIGLLCIWCKSATLMITALGWMFPGDWLCWKKGERMSIVTNHCCHHLRHVQCPLDDWWSWWCAWCRNNPLTHLIDPTPVSRYGCVRLREKCHNSECQQLPPLSLLCLELNWKAETPGWSCCCLSHCGGVENHVLLQH